MKDEEETLALAKDLMRYDTISPVTDPAVFRFLEGVLADQGIEAEIHESNGVYSLTAETGAGEPRICLNGHVDVVEPGNGWTVTDPFEPVVKDGKLYGRGAADMKAALAAQIMAFIDLHRDGFEGHATLMVVGDEEEGGFNGTQPLIAELPRFDYAVVGEPTDFNVQVGVRGIYWADIFLHGQTAHASRPQQGVNATDALPRVLEALRDLELTHEPDEALPAPTAPITVVETDGPQNSIPGEARIGLDIRYTPGMTEKDVENDVRAALDPLDVDYGMRIVDHGAAFKLTDDRFRSIVTDAIQKVRGTRPDHITDGGSSDGRFFAGDGMPFVEIGVNQEPVHQQDEHCAVDDLPDLRDVYCLIAKRLASV